MADEYYLSVSSPLFILGKPKKTSGEIQGNPLDFKSASVC